ncbi:MAG: endonuclease/exonuclease/phosphatase family protein [Desulfobacterales bacterium]|nr:endonuclease/exonuclease/phosphatase family protein [Desulfobacterales bacterium]
MTDKLKMNFRLINWNIGGAKFLELPNKSDWDSDTNPNKKKPEMFRAEFKENLHHAVEVLIRYIYKNAHVITLQEVVQFHEDGDNKNPKNIFPESFFKELGYRFHFFPLIDTQKFSAQAKWVKIKKNGYWNQNAYFAQGNAILVKETMNLFPVWSIPKLDIKLEKYMEFRGAGVLNYRNELICRTKEEDADSNQHITECSREIEYASEKVFVEQGLYFGDRNTEPRAAIITHIVLDGQITSNKKLKKPLDIFIVNLHLTTLQHEREGIPSIDEKGENRRLKQLDIVFNDIISRYNSWKQQKDYKLRDEEYPIIKEIETVNRHKPVWIVAGDFNFTPTSTEYQYIVKRNFISLIKDDPPTKAKGLGKSPTLTVDYVFAGPLYYSIDPSDAKNRITNNRVESENDQIKVSDHYPMLVQVPILVEEEG